jgi:hypothetical protein
MILSLLLRAVSGWMKSLHDADFVYLPGAMVVYWLITVEFIVFTGREPPGLPK